jgi:hypothetical protein
MKNIGQTNDAKIVDLVKAQFLSDCITASVVKNSFDEHNASYTIDWEAFGKFIDAPETLICRSEKAWSKFAKMSAVVKVLKCIGSKLKLKG